MKGLQYPKANYFPTPNNICEIIAELNGSEVKVLFYILRHTWGFPEDDRREPKRLSFDDFLFGREARSRKTGKMHRMDTGCGVTAKSTVSKALRGLALKHHLILIIEDRHDGGRVKKQYRARVPEDDGYPDINDLDEYEIMRANELETVDLVFPTGDPELSKVHEEFPKVHGEFPRSNPIIEKETIERNWRKGEDLSTILDNIVVDVEGLEESIEKRRLKL